MQSVDRSSNPRTQPHGARLTTAALTAALIATTADCHALFTATLTVALTAALVADRELADELQEVTYVMSAKC